MTLDAMANRLDIRAWNGMLLAGVLGMEVNFTVDIPDTPELIICFYPYPNANQ